MRTGEIVDLANERRLSAVLDFTCGAVDLLVLNGGSRAEEVAVETSVKGRERTKQRSVYCIDSGTSVQLQLPIAPGSAPSDLVVAIAGGQGRMVLSLPKRPRPANIMNVRGLSMVCAALALLVLAGGQLDSPNFRLSGALSADPEPAPVDAPLVKARVSLRVPAHLPHVVAQLAPLHPPAAVAPVTPVAKPVEHRAVLTASAAAPASSLTSGARRHDQTQNPAPRMTDLRVPSVAKSGDFVPVHFGAVGRQVKIVASIGPTIVSKTIVSAQHGTITIRSPKSDRDSRIMTVRAYAQDGNRTSTLQAMVVLVHP